MYKREELLSMLRERLTPKRILHTLGVESVAVCLAMRWGENTETASASALLHDMTKEAPCQLQLMARYDILPSVWEKTVPNVYHALTGAALARELGYGDGAASAIRWHTTGRAGMTMMEKILYTADKSEPFRPLYSGITEIRRLMFTDIDRALEIAIQRIMLWNRERGEPVEHNSVEALEWLKCQSAY
jgi:nicotinate-nucleotide adenylyltransferase